MRNEEQASRLRVVGWDQLVRTSHDNLNVTDVKVFFDHERRPTIQSRRLLVGRRSRSICEQLNRDFIRVL